MDSLALAAWKALGATLSFALAGLGCWVAKVLNKDKKGKAGRDCLLMLGNTLASGILLAAALVHMLPDAAKALQFLSEFPIAPTIAGFAFCFLVIVGEVAGSCMPSTSEPHGETDCASYQAKFTLWPHMELMPPHGCDDYEPKECCAEGVLAEAPAQSSHHSFGVDSGLGHGQEGHVPVHGHDLGHGHGAGSLVHSTSSRCRVHRHSACTSMPPGVVVHASDQEQPLLGREGQEQGMEAASAVQELKSFLLFAALCFHSVMEGLGLGSVRDRGLFLSVIIAILAHKGLAAFALGCSLAQSSLPEWKFWTFVLIFSAGTPLGCLLGALTSDSGSDVSNTVQSGICMAMASGTFLQVSTMELLPRAFAEEKHKVVGSVGLTLGFGAMSFLAIWC